MAKLHSGVSDHSKAPPQAAALLPANTLAPTFSAPPARAPVARSKAFARGLCAAIMLMGPHAANAEYDAQGRYVPSPMGVPADPYRSYVPGYTGKPGGTKRFAPTPRGFQVQPPKIQPFDGRLQPRNSAAPLPAVYPTRAQCRAGWSRGTGIPRARFKTACRAASAPQGQ
ncbi:MAG: hypothetical protein ABL893_20855 [Hyphomicrobium sp.]